MLAIEQVATDIEDSMSRAMDIEGELRRALDSLVSAQAVEVQP